MSSRQAPDVQAEHPQLQDQHETAALAGTVHGEGEEGRARGGEGGEAVRGEADPKPGAACQDTRYS